MLNDKLDVHGRYFGGKEEACKAGELDYLHVTSCVAYISQAGYLLAPPSLTFNVIYICV